MKKKLLLASLLVLACIVGGVLIFNGLGGGEEAPSGGSGIGISPEPQLAEPINLSILCAGDVMAHSTQITAQLQSDGNYDFSNNFQYIRHYVEAADVAICNVETTFAGTPYTGYPAFSAPEILAQNLKDVGFDVASTANNHMLDKGLSGAMRTLEVLREAGIKTTGSITDSTEPRYAIYETKGVKVGVIAYTYQNSTTDGTVSINGNRVSGETASHINSFNYAFIDNELAKIKGIVDETRAAGADVVILFYHWGEEYQLSANKWQQYMARQSVDTMDVDIIFGSHPHVLQNAEMLSKIQLVARDQWGRYLTDSALEKIMAEEGIEGTASDLRQKFADACVAEGRMIPVREGGANTFGDLSDEDREINEKGLAEIEKNYLPKNVRFAYETKNVPVYYSLGNLISNQRAETLNNKYTEEGVLAMVELKYQPDTGEVLDVKMGGVTTWVDRYSTGGRQNYYVIPLDESLESNETLATSGHMSRAKDAKEVSYGILGIN